MIFAGIVLYTIDELSEQIQKRAYNYCIGHEGRRFDPYESWIDYVRTDGYLFFEDGTSFEHRNLIGKCINITKT